MPNPPPSTVCLRPWIDPVVEAVGAGPTSTYVEYCWLPILGPTATWLYRRLGRAVESGDQPMFNLTELGRSLGVRPTLSPNGPLVRSLVRLERFGVVRSADTAILVRRALAPLSAAQLRSLPEGLQRVHTALLHP